MLKQTALALALGFLCAPALCEDVGEMTVTTAPANAQEILFLLERANGIGPDQVRSIDIIDAGELNAATDGENIYFTSALWAALKTDDQRAFVIGHELAHIKLSHIRQTQARQAGIDLANTAAVGQLGSNMAGLKRKVGAIGGVGIDTGIAVTQKTLLSLLDKKFSREQEFGADDLGLQMMDKAGYDTAAAIEVFEVLKRSDTGTVSGKPEFLMNHPLDQARIAKLSKKYELITAPAVAE